MLLDAGSPQCMHDSFDSKLENCAFAPPAPAFVDRQFQMELHCTPAAAAAAAALCVIVGKARQNHSARFIYDFHYTCFVLIFTRGFPDTLKICFATNMIEICDTSSLAT